MEGALPGQRLPAIPQPPGSGGGECWRGGPRAGRAHWGVESFLLGGWGRGAQEVGWGGLGARAAPLDQQLKAFLASLLGVQLSSAWGEPRSLALSSPALPGASEGPPAQIAASEWRRLFVAAL